MQALKLIIQGSYYDSQIYSGRLYLWSNEGTIITVDWDRLIKSIKIEDRLRLALDCAFRRSAYLYHIDFELLFQDAEIKSVLMRKFEDLSKSTLAFSKTELERWNVVIAEQENPLVFPHADSQIYKNTLYIGSPAGVSSSTLSSDISKGKKPLSSQGIQLWDGPALNISAALSTLALASGSEGLFQLPLSLEYSSSSNPYQISKDHSVSVRWMYASIFSSSYFNDGYLAYFTIEEEEKEGIQEITREPEIDDWSRLFENEDQKQKKDQARRVRKLQEVIPSSSIFSTRKINGDATYSWGVQDKICLASKNSINVVRYSPYNTSDSAKNKRFTPLGKVNIRTFEGDIISGDSAVFGFVLELEDGLQVIASDMESNTFLPGEPVNWRVFPRSKFYTNQLHVVYEDYICIYSFNQDYFVNQKDKTVGIRLPKSYIPGKAH